VGRGEGEGVEERQRGHAPKTILTLLTQLLVTFLVIARRQMSSKETKLEIKRGQKEWFMYVKAQHSCKLLTTMRC
jgi:hypothetical protein